MVFKNWKQFNLLNLFQFQTNWLFEHPWTSDFRPKCIFFEANGTSGTGLQLITEKVTFWLITFWESWELKDSFNKKFSCVYKIYQIFLATSNFSFTQFCCGRYYTIFIYTIFSISVGSLEKTLRLLVIKGKGKGRCELSEKISSLFHNSIYNLEKVDVNFAF